MTEEVSTKVWRCRDFSLPVFDRVHVMGIINVTPDSFSDGGRFFEPDVAVKHGMAMAEDGADIIDVGGESTRPGAQPVDVVEEMDRVIPVISRLVREIGLPISIDTTKAQVAEAALDAGAAIVNDVSAMRLDPTMPEVVASSEAGLVLMHMLGEPRTMQANPSYDDVVSEVARALEGWAAAAEASGIEPGRIAIDPGIGFGKTVQHSLTLVKYVSRLGSGGSTAVAGARTEVRTPANRWLARPRGWRQPGSNETGSGGSTTVAGARTEVRTPANRWLARPRGWRQPGSNETGSGGPYPLVLGPSRKSFIGLSLDLPAEERLEGTAAVVGWAAANGVNVLRVHDVKEMVRVVRMVEAIKGA